jgi:hypothetical protein
VSHNVICNISEFLKTASAEMLISISPCKTHVPKVKGSEHVLLVNFWKGSKFLRRYTLTEEALHTCLEAAEEKTTKALKIHIKKEKSLGTSSRVSPVRPVLQQVHSRLR